MDGPEFDAWTRRRFGLATGGALAALAGFGETGAASKKSKKRKKKRCRKHLQTCKPGGKRKCCGKLRCDFHSGNSLEQEVCCKRSGQSCEEFVDCCFPLGCDEVTKECRESIPSDRAIKSNFGSVDPADMLASSVMQRTDGTAEPREQRVDWFFVCDSWRGEPTILEPRKCAELAWFDLDALPGRVPEYERLALEAIRDGRTSTLLSHGF